MIKRLNTLTLTLNLIVHGQCTFLGRNAAAGCGGTPPEDLVPDNHNIHAASGFLSRSGMQTRVTQITKHWTVQELTHTELCSSHNFRQGPHRAIV